MKISSISLLLFVHNIIFSLFIVNFASGPIQEKAHSNSRRDYRYRDAGRGGEGEKDLYWAVFTEDVVKSIYPLYFFIYFLSIGFV